MLHLDDTIAAISTPPGEGGIGVVRLSGPQALEIAGRLFHPSKPGRLDEVPSHTLHHRILVYQNQVLDEALVAVMRAPHSYTREDVVELQVHGSPVVVRQILEATLACGARAAEPGEFTQRAFLNGRLNLDQSQAVLDLIQAKTQLSARYAMDRLEGKFSQPLKALSERLSDLLAGVGVGMDYPDYEEDALPRAVLVDGLKQAVVAVRQVLARARDGRILREGYAIAIVGKPNVGKSTLLNALLNSNRALVTPVAGTTRDTLEEFVEIRGVPFRLVDTAGLRHSPDEVERLGMQRTRAAVDRADLVLVVLDLMRPLSREDRDVLEYVGSKPNLVLLNKCDVVEQVVWQKVCEALSLTPETSLPISAHTGLGLETLKERLVRRVWGGTLPKHETVFFLDLREKDLLQRALKLLQQASQTAAAAGTLDLIAIEVQEALEVLGELTGESASEAVIERIFAKFCVGK